MKDIVVFKGAALDEFLKAMVRLSQLSYPGDIYGLQFAIDEGGLKWKVNEYTWTPARGEMKESVTPRFDGHKAVSEKSAVLTVNGLEVPACVCGSDGGRPHWSVIDVEEVVGRGLMDSDVIRVLEGRSDGQSD